jgi:hypothetical protein
VLPEPFPPPVLYSRPGQGSTQRVHSQSTTVSTHHKEPGRPSHYSPIARHTLGDWRRWEPLALASQCLKAQRMRFQQSVWSWGNSCLPTCHRRTGPSCFLTGLLPQTQKATAATTVPWAAMGSTIPLPSPEAFRSLGPSLL